VIERLKQERLKSKERISGAELDRKTYEIIGDLTRGFSCQKSERLSEL